MRMHRVIGVKRHDGSEAPALVFLRPSVSKYESKIDTNIENRIIIHLGFGNPSDFYILKSIQNSKQISFI